jgi:DNA-binding winged helix-turn-helix (wHTH) protein/TolB-like protein
MPSTDDLMKGFEFGRWSVLPERGLIRSGEVEKHIEPLVMDVFVVLAAHEGQVVNRDQLVNAVWDGRPVTDEVITRCIAVLRRNLEDDAKSPQFIETLPRRGYRVMQDIGVPEADAPDDASPLPPRRLYLLPLIAGFAAVIVIAFYGLSGPGEPDTSASTMTSVAVFPFDCLHDAQNPSEHLCFGFSEEAISSLNEIGSLKVVRIRRLYEAGIDVGQSGIVTGSVQIIGDQEKVAAQLEDARDGHIVWSSTFDAATNSIFETQKQVAYAISRAIDSNYVAQKVGQRTLAAEEAYSLARYLFEKRERQSTLDAIEQFEEAIRLDPDYGPAWLGLALTYIIWPDYDVSVNREEIYDKALEVVGEGIIADPGISDAAGTVYGFVFHKRSDWIAAVESFEMAINSETVEPIAHAWYSRALASVGRLDDAYKHAVRARELDPGHPDQAIIISRMAITSFWLNDLETAARYFEIASTMQLEAPIHNMAYSMFLIRTGQYDKAVTLAKLGFAQGDLPTDWVDPVFIGLHDAESRDGSMQYLDELTAAGWFPKTIEVALWNEFGDIDRAMSVARSVEQNPGALELEIIFVEEFKAFRQHPEFADFTEAIGLNEYWNSVGCEWQDDRIHCAE